MIRRLARLAGAAGVLLGATIVPVAAHAQPPLTQNSVTTTAVDVSPTTPNYSADEQALTITVRLTNTTAQPLYGLQLDPVREAPVTQPSILDDLLAHPHTLDATVSLPGKTLDAPLAAHASTTVVYRTTTSRQDTPTDICLCNPGIYPIDVTVRAAATPDGELVDVGFAQTFLPSFPEKPQPVQVSWLWPLIDRPHRTTQSDVFTDDDLAKSVSPGGRLDRALSVVEKVEPQLRLTVVIDPELLDELATMTVHYSVRTAGGKLVTGTGGPAARKWLDRLQAVAAETDISLTAPADPDVEALTQAGRTWSSTVSSQVRAILGGAVSTDIAWPAGGTLSSDALAAVVAHGASTVVLTGQPPAGDQNERPDAVTGVAGGTAVLLDNRLQQLAGPALSGAPGALPRLAAALAVRAAYEPNRSHYVLLAADRYVNPNPAAAARAILDTSTAYWSTSLTVRQAVAKVPPTEQPIAPGDTGAALPASLLDAVNDEAGFVTAFRSALRPEDASALLGNFSAAAQRCESSAWRADPEGGDRCVAALVAETSKWRDSVTIAQPKSAGYTLASNNAPLFVTVVNGLTVPVTVQVSLGTVNGVAGFYTDPIPEQTLQPGQRLPLKVGAHVARTGHFQVLASVATPTGVPLGDAVPLDIRSTALGTIGVVITAVAGGVLVLALVLRFTRRMRKRRNGRHEGAAAS